jgi:hypothetical protein
VVFAASREVMIAKTYKYYLIKRIYLLKELENKGLTRLVKSLALVGIERTHSF